MYKGVPRSRTKINPPPPFEPSLFGFIKPTFKLPDEIKKISKQRIMEAKAQLAKGDYKTCAETLRDLRYKLEAFASRINQKPETRNP